MSHYRILIPNSTEQPAEALRRVGLGALLDARDWQPTGAQLNGGPNGIRGLCISWDPDHVTRPGVQSPRYEFNATDDEAVEAPACGGGVSPPTQTEAGRLSHAAGRFWLLTEMARPVTPQDLKHCPTADFTELIPTARDAEHVRESKANRLKSLTRFAGKDVTLGDGQAWTFPNLAELPTRYQFNAAKNDWDESVEPKFRTTYDRIKDVFDACRNHILWDLVRDFTPEQIQETLSPAERDFLLTCTPAALDDRKVAVPFLCEMLALNYRLTPWLIDQLGLLKPSNLWPCLCACTDADALIDLHRTVQKKIALIRARGSNSNCGGGVSPPSPPATPPSETSGS